jgi:hypothetical protein
MNFSELGLFMINFVLLTPEIGNNGIYFIIYYTSSFINYILGNFYSKLTFQKQKFHQFYKKLVIDFEFNCNVLKKY